MISSLEIFRWCQGLAGRSSRRGGSSRGRRNSRRRARGSSSRGRGWGGRGGGARARGRGGSSGANSEGGAGRGNGRGGLGDSCSGSSVEGRTGDWVAGDGLVDVEDDAITGGGIELGSNDTSGLVGTITVDLQVEARGVVLSTTLSAGGVESDQLVTEDIVSWGNRLGDFDEPGVVVLDQLIVTPDTGDARAINNTDTIDLEELKGGLVNRGTVGLAAGKVVNNRAMVRFGPWGPLKADAVSGVDLDVALTSGSVLVADDVGGRVVIRGKRAVASVGSGPGGYSGGIFAHVGERVDIKSLIVDAVDHNVADMAVGSDLGGREEGRQKGSRLNVTHFVKAKKELQQRRELSGERVVDANQRSECKDLAG